MNFLFYLLFLAIAAYGVYSFLRPYWFGSDVEETLKKRKFNKDLYEKVKEAAGEKSYEAAKFCKDKIDKLSNSKH